uniref:MD-2-related lipid-recognition domain-containing protein n=1 Tax=Glossina brevipalpis TaxID=37001 RepID=A0A1A9WB61_9MUSC
MNSLNVVVIIFISALTAVQSTKYRFIPDYYELYKDCKDQPGLGGTSDFFDLSGFDISFDDEGLNAKGTIVFLWDIEQTDRVLLDIELKKYSRGNWQLTPFTVKIFDLCQQMRDTTSIVYKSWTKHVITKNNEKIPCLGKGVEFLHEPYASQIEADVMGMNMEGRYKIVLIFQAFDGKNRAKSKSICIEMPGEIIRI